MKLYVAYGSNMDDAQMEVRCPDAKLFGKGWLPGYRLAFRGSLTGYYATIEKGESLRGGVPVLLWLISDADETRLDRYEGFPRFYQKETIEVERVMERLLDTDDRIDAWTPHGIRHGLVYIMTEGSPYGTPSKRYMNAIFRAYLKYGMDPGALTDGVNYSYDRGRRQETCSKKE